MRLTSTVPSLFDGTTRRPFISTSVRLVPRPRSATLAWPPFDGLFEVMLTAGTNCGMLLSSVSIVVVPVAWMSSASTVTIGLLAT